jgi:membrane dipeptidase
MGPDKGLTKFGSDIVERMNTVGMAVDISHCGVKTSMDAITSSKKPVLITHSNCRALAPGVARCKPDDVIKAAARTGGVMGITAVRNFVKAGGGATMEDVLNHFDYLVKLVGVEHVGIGSDFDVDAHPAANSAGLEVRGMNRPMRIFELTEGLLRRGYSDADVQLILGGNFQRVLSEIWKSGAGVSASV